MVNVGHRELLCAIGAIFLAGLLCGIGISNLVWLRRIKRAIRREEERQARMSHLDGDEW